MGLVLRKMWNWSLNQGSNLGCAVRIAGIWYGGDGHVPAAHRLC